jgi:hypothetical protein
VCWETFLHGLLRHLHNLYTEKVTTFIFPRIFMEQTALDEWYNVSPRNREHQYLLFSMTNKISPFMQWPQWFISLFIRFEFPNSGFLGCVAYVFHDLYLPGSLPIVTLGLVEKEANATIKFMLPTRLWVIRSFFSELVSCFCHLHNIFAY